MHSDRFLGLENLDLARELYQIMGTHPILSPHGHVDPTILLENIPFTNPVDLLITPDHYITRMLFSQGVSYESLSIPRVDGSRSKADAREVWSIFAANWRAFRSTPSRIWFQETLVSIFGISEEFTTERAGYIFDEIAEKLASPEFLPRTLFKKFNIELLATTDATSDSLATHAQLALLDLGGRVIPTFRPDDVSDPQRAGWSDAIAALEKSSKISCSTFDGLMSALRNRRAHFASHGATATDHGLVSARTLDWGDGAKEALYSKVQSGKFSDAEAGDFRAVMTFEHGVMAAEDGLVMQLHPGSCRDYSDQIASRYGRDKGFDIPLETHFVRELQPLLNKVGHHPNFRMVIFTLDESAFSREIAPLAGVFASLRIGPPWWFLDSLKATERWRNAVTETAGYYNTVGFIDDTRAFCSIPVRHDVARRFDAGYLAREVAQHQISKSDALELASDLSYNLSKDFFKL